MTLSQLKPTCLAHFRKWNSGLKFFIASRMSRWNKSININDTNTKESTKKNNKKHKLNSFWLWPKERRALKFKSLIQEHNFLEAQLYLEQHRIDLTWKHQFYPHCAMRYFFDNVGNYHLQTSLSDTTHNSHIDAIFKLLIAQGYPIIDTYYPLDNLDDKIDTTQPLPKVDIIWLILENTSIWPSTKKVWIEYILEHYFNTSNLQTSLSYLNALEMPHIKRCIETIVLYERISEDEYCEAATRDYRFITESLLKAQFNPNMIGHLGYSPGKFFANTQALDIAVIYFSKYSIDLLLDYKAELRYDWESSDQMEPLLYIEVQMKARAERALLESVIEPTEEDSSHHTKKRTSKL